MKQATAAGSSSSSSSKGEKLSRAVLALRAGDESAMVELIQLTEVKLFRYCVILTGNRELAQDLCQDVYLKAFEKIDGLREPAWFATWLITITRNLYISRVRSDSIRPHAIKLDPEDLQALLENEEEEASQEAILHAQHALMSLDPEDRFLVLLCYLEGQTPEQAAEVLGISEGAAKSRIHRAKEALIKKIQEE